MIEDEVIHSDRAVEVSKWRSTPEDGGRLTQVLKSVVQGYFNYHAIPGNANILDVFRSRVTRLWRQTLICRGQKHHLNWARMQQLEARWRPKLRILHPWLSVRFDVTHPR